MEERERDEKIEVLKSMKDKLHMEEEKKRMEDREEEEEEEERVTREKALHNS